MHRIEITGKKLIHVHVAYIPVRELLWRPLRLGGKKSQSVLQIPLKILNISI